MFSRLASNRSPQHKAIDYGKKKVVLPASVFNKVDKDRSVSRQPKTNRSLTPEPKMQLVIQPCRSKPLLVSSKPKNAQLGDSKSSFKSYCSNCSNLVVNHSNKSMTHCDLPQQVTSVRNSRRRNELQDLLEGLYLKSVQVYENKESYEVEQQRMTESFNKEKEKINEFYNKMMSVLVKHKQGTIRAFEHKKQKALGQIQSIIHCLESSLEHLSSIQHQVFGILPGVDKSSQQTFEQTILSFRSRQNEVTSKIKMPKFEAKQIHVAISDEHLITKRLTDLVQRSLTINNLSNRRREGTENMTPNAIVVESLEGTYSSLKSKLSMRENPLQKYLSAVDNQESECEMLLSKRG